MEAMSDSFKSIKKFSIKVGRTLVKFSRRGVRVRARYRLQYINDSRMKTLWSLSGTKRQMILAAIAAFFVISIGGAAILGVTPLRTLLPGYLKRSQRSEMADMTQRLDSLRHIAAVNNLYLDNMVAILNDEIDIDSLQQAYNDSINRLSLPVDSLLATSEAEKEFVRRHEQRERFNVSVLTPVAADGMIFYKPVSSSVAQSVDNSGRITYQLRPSSPVSAVYRGTVIESHYEPGQGYTLVVQHPHDFITRYTGIAEPLVKAGAKVNTGTRIGLSADGNESPRQPVTFDMWYNGTQIDPTSYLEPVQ